MQPPVYGPSGLAHPAVVMVADFARVEGGATKVAIDQAIMLAESGIRVVYFSAVGPIEARLAASPVQVICLGQHELIDVSRHPSVALQALWNQAAFRRMSSLLATLDPANTIIHLHNATKALSASPIAAVHRRRFRTVCTLHDFFSACPNGAFFDYVRQAPCPRTALSFDCVTSRCDKRHAAHKLFRVARSTVHRTAGRFPRSVSDYIAMSEKSVSILRPYLPVDARFHRLKNPIQVQQKPPANAAANTCIICVGRLDREKGVTLLADAAALVGASIVFVGDGPMRAELESRPGVTLTGWLPPQDVAAWYERARCVVFPSLWYETFGLVVEEAAARGVPSLVSNVTAAAERVIDGVTGWHFASGDTASLAAKLAIILNNGAIAAAGQAAYDRFWQDLSSTAGHFEALTGIYRTVMNPGHNTAPEFRP